MELYWWGYRGYIILMGAMPAVGELTTVSGISFVSIRGAWRKNSFFTISYFKRSSHIIDRTACLILVNNPCQTGRTNETYAWYGSKRVNDLLRLTVLASKRAGTIDTFRHDFNTEVFLCLTSSTMPTLDLTCASQAFVMEPHPLIEEQVINRILCIGQRKEVSINRYVMDKKNL